MLKTPAKPKHCPCCNSTLVAEIIHEINSLSPAIEQDLNDRKAVLGVNLKGRANPKWQCMDCGAQIYGPDRASPPDPEKSVILPTDLGSWVPFSAKSERKGK